MKTNNIIAVIALLIIFSAGSFFIGTKYQQRKTVSQLSQRFGFNDESRQIMGRNTNDVASGDITKNRGQMPGFRQTIGEIINIDDKSMTIKLVDDSSKIVLFSDSTAINQSVEASKSDLKVGINVAVNGNTNSDGSVTSNNIEINPHITTITPAVKQ